MRPGRPYAGRPPEESPSPARARRSAFGARGSARKKGLGTRGSGLGYAHPEPRVPNPEPLDGSSGPVNHALLFERRLSCGETGDGHAERRAGHVGHAHTVTEFHRRGLATVLPTDADLDLGPRSPAELDIRLCGEHGGEPASVKFCHRVGMTYVSCSPFRVPIARLAAAQAALEEQGVINRTRATV